MPRNLCTEKSWNKPLADLLTIYSHITIKLRCLHSILFYLFYFFTFWASDSVYFLIEILDPANLELSNMSLSRGGLEPGDAIEAAADVEMIPQSHRSHRAPLAVHGRHLAPLLRLRIEYLTHDLDQIESYSRLHPYCITDITSQIGKWFSWQLLLLFILKRYFFIFFLFMYVIQHCFICRPSVFTESEDAGLEPRTVATLALTAREL